MIENELKEIGIEDENIKIIKSFKDGSLIVLPSDNENITLLIKDTEESFKLLGEQPKISFGINQYIVNTGKTKVAIILLGFKIDDYKCFSVFFNSQDKEIGFLKDFLNATNITFSFNFLNKDEQLETGFLTLNKEKTELTFTIVEDTVDNLKELETIAAVLTFAFAKESVVDLIFDENFPTNSGLDFTPFIKQEAENN